MRFRDVGGAARRDPGRQAGRAVQPELAMGAIGDDGVRIVNDDVAQRSV
jgi:hypothetical protein